MEDIIVDNGSNPIRLVNTTVIGAIGIEAKDSYIPVLLDSIPALIAALQKIGEDEKRGV